MGLWATGSSATAGCLALVALALSCSVDDRPVTVLEENIRLPPVCKGGELDCAALASPERIVCSEGQWEAAAACPPGQVCRPSSRGSCGDIPEPCDGRESGRAFCAGSVLINCSADLLSHTVEECESEALCELAPNGTCAKCIPDAVICRGVELLKCSLDASGYESVRTCVAAELCDAEGKTCRESRCPLGEARCEGATLLVCESVTEGFTTRECGSAALCDADTKTCLIPACTAADDCATCAGCSELCLCRGGTLASCAQTCSPDLCSLALDCAGCADCVALCQCEGGDAITCAASCEPPSADDVCLEGSGGPGSGSCEGCSSCLASCTCNGTPLEECMSSCQMLACCDAGGCPAFYYDCVCPGTSSESCAQVGYPCSAPGCDECTCNNCNDLFQACQEVPDCSAIFECMRATDCEGSACAERCASGQSAGSDAFAIAEALRACDRGAGCSCDERGPTVSCGPLECSSYQTNEVSFDACCPDAGGVEPAPAGGADGCGLSLRRYFQNAPSCLAMNQPNPPPILDLLDRCPNGRIEAPPYNGAALRGCCRADGVCGFWDDITGLGCVDSSVFDGATPTSCN